MAKGFAGYSPVQRWAVSSRGGRAKVPKGLARLPKERRIEIARLGALKRHKLLNERKEEDVQSK